MNRLDQAVLQAITALVVVLAALDTQINAALQDLFPGAQVAIPVTAFVLLYQLLVFLYGKLLWPVFHRSNYVGGRWVYGLHNEVTDKQLYGIFVVRQGFEGTQIREGAVWFAGGPPKRENQRGTWQSTIAVVNDDKLRFVFAMTTLASEERAGPGKEVEGTMQLNLEREDGVPTQMSGRFDDHAVRAVYQGTVEARRVRAWTRSDQIAEAHRIFGRAGR